MFERSAELIGVFLSSAIVVLLAKKHYGGGLTEIDFFSFILMIILGLISENTDNIAKLLERIPCIRRFDGKKPLFESFASMISFCVVVILIVTFGVFKSVT
jgi:hypothetical protein